MFVFVVISCWFSSLECDYRGVIVQPRFVPARFDHKARSLGISLSRHLPTTQHVQWPTTSLCCLSMRALILILILGTEVFPLASNNGADTRSTTLPPKRSTMSSWASLVSMLPPFWLRSWCPLLPVRWEQRISHGSIQCLKQRRLLDSLSAACSWLNCSVHYGPLDSSKLSSARPLVVFCLLTS